jgi:hypothetical protein
METRSKCRNRSMDVSSVDSNRAAIASRLTVGHHWRGLPEPETLGKSKMIITLPDQSVVTLELKTLRFNASDPTAKTLRRPKETGNAPFGINCEVLAQHMSEPQRKFSDCFRRVSDQPRYSPKVDVTFLTRIYRFGGSYEGGTFCSSQTEWRFLDGGIISQNGYGWGSHSWTVIVGTESLRAVCLFFGVEQPQRIKGEAERRPLAILLEEMTSVPLQESRDRL